ncbi:CRP-like cAMP-binding protein [Chitinophaga skermanii]|uniref:CRP-like cAMP-binding protein n=1 Tax=Chitinophaga skermanii TaxID=331697 RepID=A0A327QLM2_9BACT|nr:Crp/Fnr family transcriptional regulator [Chitinophaga skermanii]RAJ05210.1 CRP-like cAMP-binding protein [Chitinophaga skermanii]
MKDIARKIVQQYTEFNDEEIDALLAFTTVESFAKGDIVVAEGRICNKCYFVLQGCLRQFRIVDGLEKTSAFYVEQDPIVLYSSYMSAQPSETSIQCMEDTLLLSGTKAQEAEMHKAYPATGHLIYNLLSADYRKAEAYIHLLNAYNPEQRYQALLQTKPGLLNRVPLVYIASYIGVTPESLSRIRKRIVDNTRKA